MLVRLSIRDVVLIDRLDLSFGRGLGVLTGETGAGKSILLDALGLALGARAEARLVRPGAERAVASAAFELAPDHPALAWLDEQGLTREDDLLVLRRVLGSDGRSRGFVNDQPVGVTLLRDLASRLVEIQGQFDQRGLLDAATHQDLLDAHAGCAAETRALAALWHAWRAAVEGRRSAEADFEAARRDEDFLRHAVAELDALAPQPGEEAALTEQRAMLRHGERLMEAINGALALLSGEEGRSGAETALSGARRALDRVADKAGGRFDPALEALDRALAESEEARAAIEALASDLDLDPHRMTEVEERFFALKDLARKHGVEVDSLAALRGELAEKLDGIDHGAERLAELERRVKEARLAYLQAGQELGDRRRAAAEALDAAVNHELPPLKLEKASFRTRVERLEEADWGPRGLDRVAFEAVTNPGAPPGPLAKIASGGELSRFLLALKVVLADSGPGRTLIFDEVDSGIGGATAHAVGERLARLALDRQVLVVTHSPQVAARACDHWRVSKEPAGDRVETRVGHLADEERREEIARMLSGAEVTDEARAAAERLLGAA